MHPRPAAVVAVRNVQPRNRRRKVPLARRVTCHRLGGDLVDRVRRHERRHAVVVAQLGAHFQIFLITKGLPQAPGVGQRGCQQQGISIVGAGESHDGLKRITVFEAPRRDVRADTCGFDDERVTLPTPHGMSQQAGQHTFVSGRPGRRCDVRSHSASGADAFTRAMSLTGSRAVRRRPRHQSAAAGGPQPLHRTRM